MSEKHGQLGEQWTKSAAPAASAQASNSIPIHLPIPVVLPLQKPNASPYGNCSLQPADIVYNATRFQGSAIHAKASPLTITPVGPGSGAPAAAQISPTSHTHVPVPVATPSGFVPPPFPIAAGGGGSGGGGGVGVTTSVLTPNQFATATGNTGAGLTFANAFTFNAAQQLGLGKIMHAMGGATGGVSAVSVPVTTNPSAAAPSAPTITGQRHPNDAVPAAGGVINSTIAENVMNALSNSKSVGASSVSSDEKMRRVQQVIEGSLDDNAKLQISQILERVSGLKPIEKLFLYLRLPGECADTDPLRQPQNPLGTRSEINHTINWVRSHLEHDAQVSIPKQDVYNDYIAYCERLSIKPLSTADFGKVMKQVFPDVRPRRLGTRGNSRYCYAAMRKTTKLTPPQLPQLCKTEQASGGEATADVSHLNNASSLGALQQSPGGESECWDVVRSWAEKLLNTKLESVADLSSRIRSNNATVSAKKYTPREPKEKRVLADIGPLKKRRKKKRKGSTSSESSCNQLVAGQDAGSSQEASDEQLLKIKQEIIDSPIQHQQPPMGAAYLQQVTPMNLATDQRSSGAVRNLTPKILEMGSPAVLLAQQEPSPTGIVIKDEVEDYTSNIFCKKVLKAQQTKGFWANSPSSGTTSGGGLLVPPTITTTSATPPPPTNSNNSPVPGPGLSMGPPSQIMNASSVSPSGSVDSTPKVASRNQMILRAKRVMAAENAALAAAAEDSGLPENLGLPRERVISICNMDKHELDDYFLPGEDEENSEEPDTELLQYFPMGDAEEKQLNSLDAAEQNWNPQEPTTINDGSAPEAMPAPGRGAANAAVVVVAAPAAMLAPVPASTMLPGQAGVVSASASLALMSKKHQQQQHQLQSLQQQLLQRSKQLPNISNNKRKISLSNASSNGSNKNCIFLPISPNINGSNGSNGPVATTTALGTVNASQNCFASPGLTRMRQRPNLLSKQQSLDCDNRDPMIGAHRKVRGYVYSYPTSTSASAPPSPSLLQQWMGGSWSLSGGNSSSFADTSHSADPLVNQNSMDLETSLALTGANELDTSEMQRSQSVPLSQLQRRCSQQSPSLHFYSENSNSQQSAPLKDTGLLYEEVDVGSLISPNFNSKFNSITQQTATTCSSSAGSSSGYSSGGSAGIVSRSVPSTPLPHQHQSSLTSLNGAGVATASGGDVLGIGNGGNCGAGNGFFTISDSFNWEGSTGSGNNQVAYGSHSYGARNPLDISKSMPTTPIATQRFRYSPAEVHRDFLINGNTIDSLTSSAFGAGGGATDPALALSTDTLIDDSAPSSAGVVEAMIGVTDILDDF
ncbi:uncharacterized protein LOC108148309 [Drosophila elegans]|uniref:uncharacterized protein LOC108148309 n=1 Tax=Drosophila elegans TaxID=30023 RepID=UPI0007E823B6|nr:uncharacterized protein LOC108148309 [Drosophila elegans]